MTTSNRRRADRVEAAFSVKIRTHVRTIDAAVLDVSRTGLRLRLRASDMRFLITEDLEAMEHRLRTILPERVEITLDDARLGPLVQRWARVLRLGVRSGLVPALDVCCEFIEPLDDEDAQVLRVSLPPLTEEVTEWRDLPNDLANDLVEPVELTPALSPPRHRYRVFVSSTRRKAPLSVFCHTDLVTGIGVRICVPRDQLEIGGKVHPSRPADVCRQLVKRFGSEIAVRVYDESDTVWVGTMRITGAEVRPTDASHLLVSLAFVQELQEAELRRLGLASTAV